jgi:anti-sigma regulatory factor (Ser/Thr protein kinase)
VAHDHRTVGSLHVSYHDGAPDIREARNTVAEELARRGWSAPDIDRVRLVVSELAANAVLHARTHFEVHCEIDSDARIQVVDWSPGHLPQVREVEPERPGGLGMHLVDELVDDWGVERHDECKVVWCVICRSRGTSNGYLPDAPDSSAEHRARTSGR